MNEAKKRSINESDLVELANAIRDKTHSKGTFTFARMVSEVKTMRKQGNGTAKDPFIVETMYDLMSLIGLSSCGLTYKIHCKQVKDIDLSSIANWMPISNFQGVYDGCGHIVSGMTISRSMRNGLFSNMSSGAVVKNLGVVNATITDTSRNNSGALCGNVSSSKVYNCWCENTTVIRGGSCEYVGYSGGGLIGAAEGSSVIANCFAINTYNYNTAAKSKFNHFGGLIGWMTQSSIIRNSYATVKSMNSVNNGIVLSTAAQSNVKVLNCYGETHTNSFKLVANGSCTTTGSNLVGQSSIKSAGFVKMLNDSIKATASAIGVAFEELAMWKCENNDYPILVI